MTRIMGILNVTPDSFSDGGQFLDTDRAVAHAQTLVAQGASIIDVGGESTRPGARRITSEQELDRVLPVVQALTASGIAVSVDTLRVATARAAIGAGAVMINDVSGGRADSDMYSVIAGSDVDYCMMHWDSEQFESATGQHDTGDIVARVTSGLEALSRAAQDAGVDRSQILLDPGLGFAKSAEQNWELVRHLDRCVDLGFPVVVGASRKRFILSTVKAHSSQWGEDATLEDPTFVHAVDDATAGVSVLSAMSGCEYVRVHDVTSTAAGLAVLDEVKHG